MEKVKTPRISIDRPENMSIAEYSCIHFYEEEVITLGRWHMKERFTWKERNDAELAISTINHEMTHFILDNFISCECSTLWDNLFEEDYYLQLWTMLQIGWLIVA